MNEISICFDEETARHEHKLILLDVSLLVSTTDHLVLKAVFLARLEERRQWQLPKNSPEKAKAMLSLSDIEQ